MLNYPSSFSSNMSCRRADYNALNVRCFLSDRVISHAQRTTACWSASQAYCARNERQLSADAVEKVFVALRQVFRFTQL